MNSGLHRSPEKREQERDTSVYQLPSLYPPPKLPVPFERVTTEEARCDIALSPPSIIYLTRSSVSHVENATIIR